MHSNVTATGTICRVRTEPRPDAELDLTASDHAGEPVYRPEHCAPIPWRADLDTLYLLRFDVTVPFMSDDDADLIIYAASLPSTATVVSYPAHVWEETDDACLLHIPTVFARLTNDRGVLLSYAAPDDDTEAVARDRALTEYAISRGWAHMAVDAADAQAAAAAPVQPWTAWVINR